MNILNSLINTAGVYINYVPHEYEDKEYIMFDIPKEIVRSPTLIPFTELLIEKEIKFIIVEHLPVYKEKLFYLVEDLIFRYLFRDYFDINTKETFINLGLTLGKRDMETEKQIFNKYIDQLKYLDYEKEDRDT